MLRISILTIALVGSVCIAKAQLCCNVVTGSGLDVITPSNGLCAISPMMASAANCVKVADADGDGIADDSDECPHEAGPAANGGCPELAEEEVNILKAALAGVKFKTDSDELIGDSESKLDAVVALLKKHPDFKLKISGYSDNTGQADYNLELSDKRAHSAEKYIISKGIAADRISAKGYGEANPIADNDTAEGRAKNRRVEFTLTH